MRWLDEMNFGGGNLVLKIDVEGQEKRVLHGASEFFSEGRVKVIYIHCDEKPTIDSMLRSFGYKFFDCRITKAPNRGKAFGLLGIHETWMPAPSGEAGAREPESRNSNSTFRGPTGRE